MKVFDRNSGKKITAHPHKNGSLLCRRRVYRHFLTEKVDGQTVFLFLCKANGNILDSKIGPEQVKNLYLNMKTTGKMTPESKKDVSPERFHEGCKYFGMGVTFTVKSRTAKTLTTENHQCSMRIHKEDGVEAVYALPGGIRLGRVASNDTRRKHRRPLVML